MTVLGLRERCDSTWEAALAARARYMRDATNENADAWTKALRVTQDADLALLAALAPVPKRD